MSNHQVPHPPEVVMDLLLNVDLLRARAGSPGLGGRPSLRAAFLLPDPGPTGAFSTGLQLLLALPRPQPFAVTTTVPTDNDGAEESPQPTTEPSR
ncbi:hypothetical protein ACWCQM_36915 [Streptomyces sp. NPDC002125]